MAGYWDNVSHFANYAFFWTIDEEPLTTIRSSFRSVDGTIWRAEYNGVIHSTIASLVVEMQLKLGPISLFFESNDEVAPPLARTPVQNMLTHIWVGKSNGGVRFTIAALVEEIEMETWPIPVFV